jgi:hypothetical protein
MMLAIVRDAWRSPSGPGRTRLNAKHACALLARHGIRTVIPRRRDQHPDDGRFAPFDHRTYRERSRVERLVN